MKKNIDFEIKNNPNYPNLIVNEKKLFKKLKNTLPKEISDDALWYIIDCTKKRANSPIENGQIFSYKTGKPTSIEFHGNKTAVRFKSEGLKVNIKDLNEKELKNFFSIPLNERYTSYITEDSLAMQHNHTKAGYNVPSSDDFELLMANYWADYLFTISNEDMGY